MVVVVRFVLFFFILCLAVLGVHSQRTDHAPAKQATCEELTHAISVNQLSLLKIMGQGSYASIGMAEWEARRVEAAARDAKLQEMETRMEDMAAMVEKAAQETAKGMAEWEERRVEAAARDARLQEMETRMEDMAAMMEKAAQETAKGMTEIEARRVEAAARDAKLQEMGEVVDDLRAMLDNATQETVKGIAERELRRQDEAAERDARLQKIEAALENLKANVEKATEETAKGVAAQLAALRQEMTREVTSQLEEIVSNLASLREEVAAQDRVLDLIACPDGWLRRESSCYLVNSDTRRSWEDSLAYCRGLGGDLAKITSADEDEFIATHLREGTGWNYWIGLNDRARERRFVWTDGSAATFTRWREGWSHDNGGGRDCVFMFSYDYTVWSDTSCSSGYYCVCERAVHA